VIEAYAENLPPGADPDGIKKLYKGIPAFVRGEGAKDSIRYAFGAQFVEVRVHRRTAEIRVPRTVGAYAAGTIVNPKTAQSQLMGAMIWGISAALLEHTEIDPRTARYTNKDLSEYIIPVNADIGEIEVIILPEQDSVVNPLGIKGIGELGNVGMNAAVVNAVYHATGIRVREIPVRLEQLLASPFLTKA
jgi:xanthine dehydrogenase YagR molybdenum-binding subunit